MQNPRRRRNSNSSPASEEDPIIATMPTAHALIHTYRIWRVTHNVLFIREVMLSLARDKSRSLESANDAKTGERSVFGEIHTNHAFGTP